MSRRMFRFDVAALACAASRARCLRLRASASSATARTVQAFARFLGRADVLDPAGGTDIFQMAPGRVKISAGTDALACLRLSGKVLRWYSECCRTPIANTAAGPSFPVLGIVHSFMGHEGGRRSRDEVLGPPVCRIFERSAVGPLPPNAPPPPSLGAFVRRASKLIGWWAGGLAGPTPFFDERTKAPIAEPRTLTPGA